MCAPVAAIATVGALAINTVSDVLAQKARSDAQQKQFEDNRDSAREELTLTLQDLQAREQEEGIAAQQELRALERQRATARSSTVASAEGAGVRGQSVAALLATVDADTGLARDSINQNLEITKRQIGRAKVGARAQARSRINGVSEGQGIDPLSTGLRFAGNALTTVSTLRSQRPNNGNNLTI